MVVLPLKKQRGGKFLNPWEEPDQMSLDEVRRAYQTILMVNYDDSNLEKSRCTAEDGW